MTPQGVPKKAGPAHGASKDAPPKKPKSSVRNRKKSEASSVQRYLPIAEIREDTVLLKNGGHRAVIAVSSMNFMLKSEQEQQGIIITYQQFLNTLTFPIQVVIRSTKLDIDAYIADIVARAAKHENPLLKEQTLDYADFIRRMVDVSEIMQKRFYVVIPMDPPSAAKATFFQKYMSWLSPQDTKAKAATRRRVFQETNGTLRDRVNLVQVGLEGMGLKSKRLSTLELIELYYGIYNPNLSQWQKVRNFGSMDAMNVSGEVF